MADATGLVEVAGVDAGAGLEGVAPRFIRPRSEMRASDKLPLNKSAKNARKANRIRFKVGGAPKTTG